MTIEFKPWGKTPRFFRDMIITEKIDGTNAAVRIVKASTLVENDPVVAVVGDLAIFAQSRNRLITPEADNYGFAAWVLENKDTISTDLGLGDHFGEWFGQGINRGYDLNYRAFALFSSRKIGRDGFFDTPNLRAVPTISKRTFDQSVIEDALRDLRENGSHLNREFKNPEGIIIKHTQMDVIAKVTLDNQDRGKWENEK